KRQTLLFLNRRGTAPTTLCANCGWTALCATCYVPLTLHADKHLLACHICARRQQLPPSCPECRHPDIVFKGIGTKMVEEAMKRLFPKANIARFDADNAQTETLAARYQEVYDAKIDILIGTQLLAKGLDLPNLQTIGVVQADSGMQLPDYQAEERTFQLLYQVAGRVGRGQQPSHIVVQSYRPDNPIVRLALARDYSAFYNQQLAERRKAHFPPFVYLLKLTCAYKTEAAAIRAASQLATNVRQTWPQCTVLGPTPAFYERLGGNYRWQIVIKAKRRADLLEIAKAVPDKWQVDIDPISLL
ncbi:MAG TPA: primosomal protein N', partial [Candidatus Acidoferrum sp.]|nr:primosomal protein N' [Candidatus Acidoferrum sp.]